MSVSRPSLLISVKLILFVPMLHHHQFRVSKRVAQDTFQGFQSLTVTVGKSHKIICFDLSTSIQMSIVNELKKFLKYLSQLIQNPHEIKQHFDNWNFLPINVNSVDSFKTTNHKELRSLWRSQKNTSQRQRKKYFYRISVTSWMKTGTWNNF